jgi:hypothetical protein
VKLYSCTSKKCWFWKIGEKSSTTPSEKYGETKFGMERFINGFLDLITIWFLSRLEKTHAFICAMGSLMFIIGLLLAVYIGVSKLYHMYNNIRYSLVTDNPWFYCFDDNGFRNTIIFSWFFRRNNFRTKNNEERYKIAKEQFIVGIA